VYVIRHEHKIVTRPGVIHMNKYFAATLLLAWISFAQAETLIHAGRLIDVQNGSVATDQTIVVDGEHISGIEDGFRNASEGDSVIDLKDSTLMPGWIDSHVHISNELSAESYENKFRLEPADNALRSTRYARITLMAGFTTVRDTGTTDGVAISLRNAINQGWIDGPRILTAGKNLATTGGHGDPTNGVRSKLRGDPGPAEGVVNGVEDAYKAVRARYKEGADLIKITATGGVLSEAKSGENSQYTVEEIEAIVAAARDYGFKVAAHAHGTEGMRRAVVGGVDSIEHGTFMDEEVIELMKRHGTWYVPTLSAPEFLIGKAAEPGYFSDAILPKVLSVGVDAYEVFTQAYQAGVKIAYGTDTGVSPHGENWKEFTYLVKGGMSPMEAIIAATKSASQLLGIDDITGSIETGMQADLVAVPGDPLENIKLMGEANFVMKGGKVYKSPGG
jgi:imidazolonepropionase-like amidohydrolase